MMMHRVLFLIFIILRTKTIFGILVQEHQYSYHQHPQQQQSYQNTPAGYIYNKPKENSYKPVSSSSFTSNHRLQSSGFESQRQVLSPLLFDPSLLSTSTLSNGNRFNSAEHHDPIHFDIPPAVLENFLGPNDHVYFAEDGRLLKQYQVIETIVGDVEYPKHLLGPSPLYYNSLASKYAVQRPQLTNQSPISLGSGSLGYIQLANGAAHIGSGSLGYISQRQARQSADDLRTRKAINPPGPLNFGHNFRK